MTFSINQLSKYNTSSSDSRSLDHEETILGHLIIEKEYGLHDALTYLTSYAKQETKSWDSTESASNAGFWVGIVAGGAAFMAVGAGPLGMAIGGVVAAIGSGGSWFLKDTAERVGALRRTEFELHRNHPWIRDRLWQLAEEGMGYTEIVAIYDQMIFKMFANGIPVDGNTIAGSMGITAPNFEQSPATVGPVDDGKPLIESAAIAPTELQEPIEHSAEVGNMVAAAPPMSAVSGTTTIAPSAAVAPSYGIVKDRSPVDMLVEALFAHRAIFGGQRTGKSLLASIASLGIVEKKPGTKVFYVNVFAFDSAETNAMFAHAHRKVVFDLAPASQFQAASVISAVSDLFEEFVQTTGAILIIDEAATMGDIRGNHVDAFRPLVEALTGYLGSIRDSSRKRKKAVWTIAPGIVAADLDPGMKSLMKGFSPILVAVPKMRSVYWDGQLIGSDTNLIAAQLKVNYPGYVFEVPQMNCDRACLIDAIWMPLGALSIPTTVVIPPIASPLESEESTWIAEGRSEVPFDDSWDLLLRAVATQAIVSTGLEQNIILSAVKNAQILNKTGKESEAIALLQKQLP